VFLANDLPGGVVSNPPPSPETLAQLPGTWFAPVTLSGNQPISYYVGGPWKGAAEQGAIIVLRRKVVGQTTIIYPEGNRGLLPLRQNQQVSEYALVFARP
jgi:hypothetical protein